MSFGWSWPPEAHIWGINRGQWNKAGPKNKKAKRKIKLAKKARKRNR